VAVIVSEETGQISLAFEGRIDRGLTPEDLRARLRPLLTGRARRHEPRRIYD